MLPLGRQFQSQDRYFSGLLTVIRGHLNVLAVETMALYLPLRATNVTAAGEIVFVPNVP